MCELLVNVRYLLRPRLAGFLPILKKEENIVFYNLKLISKKISTIFRLLVMTFMEYASLKGRRNLIWIEIFSHLAILTYAAI